MKITLGCLIIALILRGAFDYVTAQQLNFQPSRAEVTSRWDGPVSSKPGLVDMPTNLTFTDPLHGSWMTVGRINHKDDPNGFDPCWTYIKVNAKPIVKRIAKDKYEITFTSEIAENLP